MISLINNFIKKYNISTEMFLYIIKTRLITQIFKLKFIQNTTNLVYRQVHKSMKIKQYTQTYD